MPAQQKIAPKNSVKLTRRGAQQLLHQAVFQVCAHEGFDATTDSVLSTLADITEEMLVKFCTLLKVNTERELLSHSTGFAVNNRDVISFHVININAYVTLYRILWNAHFMISG